jgi:MOSC domain-containing protein YiiM
MRLVSVNVGKPREILHDGELVRTAIFKDPVSGRVCVRALNLEGDGQADLTAHGGVYQAVYAYPVEHYAFWAAELRREDFVYGQFGENLTVEGMLEDGVHVGDRFRIGEVVLEVSQPRVPCFKLGICMGSAAFPKQFLASGRVGFYMRVLREGELGAGDAIERIHADPVAMSVREVSRVGHLDRDDLDGARRALLLTALSPGWRRMFAERLGV